MPRYRCLHEDEHIFITAKDAMTAGKVRSAVLFSIGINVSYRDLETLEVCIGDEDWTSVSEVWHSAGGILGPEC